MKKFLFIATVFVCSTANAQLAVSTNSANICIGDCATLNAVASGGTIPYNYAWSTGATTQKIIICPSTTSTYTVTVMDATTSTASAISSISVSPPPTVAVSGNTTITSGNSTTLSASGGGTYSWSNGASGPVIIVSPAITTVYCVVATIGSCADSACTTVFVIPASIQDFYSNKSLSISPNPFSSQTSLQSDNFLQNATLTLYNSFGQEVKQIAIINSQSTIINRENLPSGLYFIRLTEDGKILAADKLVITDK